MVEHFIFACVNFAILIGGLIYLLRRPLSEFLSGRKEKFRVLIVKTRNKHEEAMLKHKKALDKTAGAGEDAKSLKARLVETGSFGREAAVNRATEIAAMIKKQTETLAIQEHDVAKAALLKEAMLRAFEEAGRTLSKGIPREEEMRLLEDSLSALHNING